MNYEYCFIHITYRDLEDTKTIGTVIDIDDCEDIDKESPWLQSLGSEDGGYGSLETTLAGNDTKNIEDQLNNKVTREVAPMPEESFVDGGSVMSRTMENPDEKVQTSILPLDKLSIPETQPDTGKLMIPELELNQLSSHLPEKEECCFQTPQQANTYGKAEFVVGEYAIRIPELQTRHQRSMFNTMPPQCLTKQPGTDQYCATITENVDFTHPKETTDSNGFSFPLICTSQHSLPIKQPIEVSSRQHQEEECVFLNNMSLTKPQCVCEDAVPVFAGPFEGCFDDDNLLYLVPAREEFEQINDGGRGSGLSQVVTGMDHEENGKFFNCVHA